MGHHSYKVLKIKDINCLFSITLLYFQLILVTSLQDVIIYTADNRNIHSVSEVASLFIMLFCYLTTSNPYLIICLHKLTNIFKQITEGERITLALWFSRDASHDEDAKLLKSLSDSSITNHIDSISSCFPILASTNMYWFPPEEASRFHSGFNICFARLHVLGFDIYIPNRKCHLSATDSSYNILKLLEEPLYLAWGDKLLTWEFVNILHALQVSFPAR